MKMQCCDLLSFVPFICTFVKHDAFRILCTFKLCSCLCVNIDFIHASCFLFCCCIFMSPIVLNPVSAFDSYSNIQFHVHKMISAFSLCSSCLFYCYSLRGCISTYSLFLIFLFLSPFILLCQAYIHCCHCHHYRQRHDRCFSSPHRHVHHHFLVF